MFCTECGEENRNDRKFCHACGSPLKDYTKPRENLLMPDDIKKEQNLVAKRNKISLVFNIILVMVILVAVGLTILTFFVSSKAQLVAVIISITFYLIFFAVWIIKTIILRGTLKSKD